MYICTTLIIHTMDEKILQIDVMADARCENIRAEELVRCKFYINGRAVDFWTTKANYIALVADGFFIRDGKEVDVSGAINTTTTYKELI